jgi:UDP-N-acetylmuramoyl-tripeptide--D-alanyl-D-alanine ligase
MKKLVLMQKPSISMKFLRLGELARHASTAFGNHGRHFNDMDELNKVVGNLASTASVLIKGSRFMKMERVVQHLTGLSVGGH